MLEQFDKNYHKYVQVSQLFIYSVNRRGSLELSLLMLFVDLKRHWWFMIAHRVNIMSSDDQSQ